MLSHPCKWTRFASLLMFATLIFCASNAAGQDLGILLNAPQDAAPASNEKKPAAADASNDAPDSKTGGVTANGSIFQTLRRRVEQSKLSEEDVKATLEVIDQGESQLAELQAKKKLLDERMAAMTLVPQRGKQLEKTLADLMKFEPELPQDDSLANLEVQLASTEADLAAAKKAVLDMETAMTRSAQRHRDIESELPLLQENLGELQAQSATGEAATDSTLRSQAQNAEAQVAADLITVRIEALGAETSLLDAEVAASLPQLRRDVAVRRAENLGKQVAIIKEAVEKQRAVEAAERVEAAEEQLATLHPVLQPIAEQNSTLAKASQYFSHETEELQVMAEKRDATLERLEASLKQAKARVETVGLTDAVGALLRNLKQSLPNPNEYLLHTAERQTLINDTQYNIFELTDQRNSKLSDAAAKLLLKSNTPLSTEERQELAADAEELLQKQRRDFLDPAIRAQTNYFNVLVSLSTTEQQIVKTVDTIRLYVDERVLWVRSAQPLSTRFVPDSSETWFLQQSTWVGSWNRLTGDFRRQILLWCASILALVFLLRFRASLRTEIADLGHQVSQAGYTRFMPTIQTLLLTILTAAPLFLTFGFLSWRVSTCRRT